MVFFLGIAVTPVSLANPFITAGSSSANVGDTPTVAISVSGASDLQAFQFDLSYDSSILNLLSFTDAGTDFEAAATAGGGSLTGLTGFPSSGLLSGVADSMSGASSGLTGPGVLLDITFQALTPGISALTLSNVFLDFSDQGFTSVNGQVCVNGTRVSCDTVKVPEPGTLPLVMALGLGLVIYARGVVRR